MTNQNRPAPGGTPVKMNIVWSPDGLVVAVGEGHPIRLPYDTSLEIALNANTWLMAQLTRGLALRRPGGGSGIVVPG